MLDYDKLMNWRFAPVEHRITPKDAMLYALGIGLGYDPLDEQQLRFVYEKDLLAFPSMASILCYPGNWLNDPRTGVDYLHQVNAGTRFQIHQPLPVEGNLVSTPRVLEIIDKGPGKGALISLEREVYGQPGNVHICTVTTTSLCRNDGGFGGPQAAGASPPRMPQGPADLSIELPTAPNQALLYRLNGDKNPLHASPQVARKAGFQQPILHGLATLGVATHAVVKGICNYDIGRLKSMNVRYTAPVIPGDTIRTDMWRSGATVYFRSEAATRNTIVLDNGQAEFQPSQYTT